MKYVSGFCELKALYLISEIQIVTILEKLNCCEKGTTFHVPNCIKTLGEGATVQFTCNGEFSV